MRDGRNPRVAVVREYSRDLFRYFGHYVFARTDRAGREVSTDLVSHPRRMTCASVPLVIRRGSLIAEQQPTASTVTVLYEQSTTNPLRHINRNRLSTPSWRTGSPRRALTNSRIVAVVSGSPYSHDDSG